jgi:hypothetical protein
MVLLNLAIFSSSAWLVPHLLKIEIDEIAYKKLGKVVLNELKEHL